ncbi:hypothetical protein GmHk_05G012751 [Glycine max]|nr:hypothetical protein GmHk_05G012751 [Glycine max]
MKSETIKPGKHQWGNNRGERETKSSKQQRRKRRREKRKQQHGADEKTQKRKKGLPAKGEMEAVSSNGGSLAARRRRAETVFVLATTDTASHRSCTRLCVRCVSDAGRGTSAACPYFIDSD